MDDLRQGVTQAGHDALDRLEQLRDVTRRAERVSDRASSIVISIAAAQAHAGIALTSPNREARQSMLNVAAAAILAVELFDLDGAPL